MPDSRQNPAEALRQEVALIRDALRNLRESVVLRVMHRDRLREEVERLQKGVEDMDRGIALAERINDGPQAERFRAEREVRAAQLEQMRASLAAAEAETEAVKAGLPAEEARLQGILTELQTRSIDRTADYIGSSGTPGIGNNAADLWERATSKIANLKGETAAREELLGTSGGSTGGSSATADTSRKPTADESAEQMLQELEARMAAGTLPAPQPGRPFSSYVSPAAMPRPAAPPPAPAPAEQDAATRARFLEFDKVDKPNTEGKPDTDPPPTATK